MSDAAQAGAVDLGAAEQLRLEKELRALPNDLWAAPSRCAGWTNARVLAHLALGSEMYRDSVRRALDGDSGAPLGPDGNRLSTEAFRAALGQQQDGLLTEPTEVILDRFAAAGQALTETLTGVTASQMGSPAWHPRATITVGTIIAFRNYELGFHGWDIRATRDPRAQVSASLRPWLVGFVRQAVPNFCKPDPRLDGRLRFEVEGAAWTARIHTGSLQEEATEAADATVRTDGSTYLLLASRRCALDSVQDRLEIIGERALAARLLEAATYTV